MTKSSPKKRQRTLNTDRAKEHYPPMALRLPGCIHCADTLLVCTNCCCNIDCCGCTSEDRMLESCPHCKPEEP